MENQLIGCFLKTNWLIDTKHIKVYDNNDNFGGSLHTTDRHFMERYKVYKELFKMKALSESKLYEAQYEIQSAQSKVKAALSSSI